MVLSNSEMSKNISFHVALCAKGLNQGWREGDSSKGEIVIKVGFPPPLGVQRGEGEFGALSRFSLPRAGGGAEVRWLGPWTAESGIRPGSRNNLLIYFCFQNKETPSARWQDEGSSFQVSPISRFEGSSWWDQESSRVRAVTAQTPPGANKKTYKTYWCFPV